MKIISRLKELGANLLDDFKALDPGYEREREHKRQITSRIGDFEYPAGELETELTKHDDEDLPFTADELQGFVDQVNSVEFQRELESLQRQLEYLDSQGNEANITNVEFIEVKLRTQQAMQKDASFAQGLLANNGLDADASIEDPEADGQDLG